MENLYILGPISISRLIQANVIASKLVQVILPHFSFIVHVSEKVGCTLFDEVMSCEAHASDPANLTLLS